MATTYEIGKKHKNDVLESITTKYLSALTDKGLWLEIVQKAKPESVAWRLTEWIRNDNIHMVEFGNEEISLFISKEKILQMAQILPIRFTKTSGAIHLTWEQAKSHCQLYIERQKDLTTEAQKVVDRFVKEIEEQGL